MHDALDQSAGLTILFRSDQPEYWSCSLCGLKIGRMDEQFIHSIYSKKTLGKEERPFLAVWLDGTSPQVFPPDRTDEPFNPQSEHTVDLVWTKWSLPYLDQSKRNSTRLIPLAFRAVSSWHEGIFRAKASESRVYIGGQVSTGDNLDPSIGLLFYFTSVRDQVLASLPQEIV